MCGSARARGRPELGVAMDTGEAETQRRILGQLYASIGERRTDELRATGASRPVEDLAAAIG